MFLLDFCFLKHFSFFFVIYCIESSFLVIEYEKERPYTLWSETSQTEFEENLRSI